MGKGALDLGSENTAQAVHQFEVFHHRAKAVAANFGVQRLDDHFDVVLGQAAVELVVLQTLQRHDRRDLSVRHELPTEVEKGRQVGVREVVGLVRISLFIRGGGDVTGRRAGRHQGMTREWHVLVIGFRDRSAAEIVGMFATRRFQSRQQSVIQSSGRQRVGGRTSR